jgi:hypothetical protein
MNFHRSLIVFLTAAMVGLTGDEAQAQSQTQTDNEFSTPLKTLNDRFAKQLTATRDYQELREIRSELRKLIPTIRTRFEELVKQLQTHEAQLTVKKQSVNFFLNPPRRNTRLALTFTQPSNFADDSGESMKRRLTALQASIPKQIEDAKKEIDKYNDNIKAISPIAKVKGATASQRTEAEEQIEDNKQSARLKKSDIDELQERQSRLDENSSAIDEIIGTEKLIADDKRNQLLLQKQAIDAETLLDHLDERAQSSLSNDNALNIFTMISTIAFATLVGAIIFYFFRIANSSNTVKNAIFAGESGIQFVTLFSVVIAIILFGVLRILEGKELSALLGGLSGYILGRGSNRRDEQQNDPIKANNPQPLHPPNPVQEDPATA